MTAPARTSEPAAAAPSDPVDEGHDDGAVDVDELREDLHRVPRPFAWLMVVAGVLGLVAAFDLTVEKIRLIEDPTYVPSCSLSPILACQNIMTSDQAELFGFPNPLLGVVAFPVVLTLGVLSLARVRLPGFVWDGLAVGGVLGIAFVSWLAFQSLYRIGNLCPWCMVVWTVVVPLGVSAVAFTVRRRSAPWSGRAFLAADTLWRWRWAAVGLWYATVVLLALQRFWDYWRTLV